MRLKESVRIDSERHYHFVPKKRNRHTFWNGNYRKITKTHTQTNISIIFNTLASNSWSSNVMRSDYLNPPRSQNAHCYFCRTNKQLYVVVWLGSRIIPFISLPFIISWAAKNLISTKPCTPVMSSCPKFTNLTTQVKPLSTLVVVPSDSLLVFLLVRVSWHPWLRTYNPIFRIPNMLSKSFRIFIFMAQTQIHLHHGFQILMHCNSTSW